MAGLELPLWRDGLVVCGVDEAGRGALAGPIVVGAVILPPGPHPFQDSKRCTPKTREALLARLERTALAHAVGVAEPGEVDALGVLKATHLAAHRALAALEARPDHLITDYLFLKTPLPLTAVPKAEAKSVTVAAASILAKVTRDRIMMELDQAYPGYGFAQHKGYGTRAHLEALARLGPSPVHRRRFAPVAQAPLFTVS